VKVHEVKGSVGKGESQRGGIRERRSAGKREFGEGRVG